MDRADYVGAQKTKIIKAIAQALLIKESPTYVQSQVSKTIRILGNNIWSR